MYYEEKVINGVLHWRGTPRGKWQKCNGKMLTDLLIESRGLLADLRNRETVRWTGVADPHGD